MGCVCQFCSLCRHNIQTLQDRDCDVACDLEVAAAGPGDSIVDKLIRLVNKCQMSKNVKCQKMSVVKKDVADLVSAGLVVCCLAGSESANLRSLCIHRHWLRFRKKEKSIPRVSP